MLSLSQAATHRVGGQPTEAGRVSSRGVGSAQPPTLQPAGVQGAHTQGPAQSSGQMAQFSVGPQQPSGHTSAGQSAGQLQRVSPPSQQPLPQVPPQSAAQVAQVSVPLHTPSPQQAALSTAIRSSRMCEVLIRMPGTTGSSVHTMLIGFPVASGPPNGG